MDITVFYQTHYRKMVLTLSARLGHQIEWAEDAIQEAVLAYQSQAPQLDNMEEALPKWIYQVAWRKALDQGKHWVQRRQTWEDTSQQREDFDDEPLERPSESGDIDELTDNDLPWQDAELKSLYLFAQPGLSTSSQVALILRGMAGWPVNKIAAYYLCPYDTIEKRLTRARSQLKAREKTHLISGTLEESRLEAVLHALYLLFSEGYFSLHESRMIDLEGMSEAFRLCALLTTHPKTQAKTEVWALLALMAYHIARLPSRIGQGNEESQAPFVSLALQDRSLWDGNMIKQASQYLNWSAQGDKCSRYHLEAAIAAIHTETQRFEDTDWLLILQYYEQLEQMYPSIATQLNRLVAQGYAKGWETVLPKLQPLEGTTAGYEGYVQLVKAMAYEQLNLPRGAFLHYEEALRFFGSQPIKTYLRAKMSQLESPQI